MSPKSPQTNHWEAESNASVSGGTSQELEKRQSTFLSQLAAQTIPNGIHCLSTRQLALHADCKRLRWLYCHFIGSQLLGFCQAASSVPGINFNHIGHQSGAVKVWKMGYSLFEGKIIRISERRRWRLQSPTSRWSIICTSGPCAWPPIAWPPFWATCHPSNPFPVISK